MRNASWRTVFTSFLFQAGFASFEFCLEKYGNLILADGILWRLNYFTSVRSRLTSAYNNNNERLSKGQLSGQPPRGGCGSMHC
jgi:hypothetical protein